MKAYDVGLQTNISILDFSKVFDTVLYTKLLSKMGEYEIRGRINNELNIFLTNRKMKDVVERDQYDEMTVDFKVQS